MKINDRTELEKQDAFGIGEKNDAYARYFVGQSYLKPLTRPGETAVFLANVTFEPGCRNNWHIHHAAKGGGQLLICTAGEGWYQEEGKPAVSLTPGTVVTVPAGVKHWHGAKADSVVLPYRRRGARRGHPHRMGRAGHGRGLRRAEISPGCRPSPRHLTFSDKCGILVKII